MCTVRTFTPVYLIAESSALELPWDPLGKSNSNLLAMCCEIWKCLPRVGLIAQYDPGIHNYLIYSGRIILDLTDKQSGIIATLHYENPSNIKMDAAAGV
jgi:hypothetical protein